MKTPIQDSIVERMDVAGDPQDRFIELNGDLLTTVTALTNKLRQGNLSKKALEKALEGIPEGLTYEIINFIA